MNQGLFSASINDSWKLLKDLGLAGDINSIPKSPDNPASLFRDKTYLETYKICLAEYYYRFQLIDGSLIQFDGDFSSRSNLQLRYAYYESPYKLITFEEYSANSGLIDNAEGNEENIEEQIRALHSMYEEDISSIAYNTLKKQALPIRYDYSSREYNEGLHPVSHFHFGYHNNVRIATKKILTPTSFCLFLTRQCYPDNWMKFHRLNNFSDLTKHVRDNLNEIDNMFWNSKDICELFLS